MTRKEQQKSPLRAILIAILATLILVPAAIYGFAYFFFWRNIPKAMTAKEGEQVSSIVVSYLNKKYGDRSFAVEDVQADTYQNGFGRSERTGYSAYVSADGVVKFKVHTEGGKADTTQIVHEHYVEEYYENDLPNAFSDDEKPNSYIDINSNAIPEDYGRFPKFNELLELGAIEELFIIQNKKSDESGEYGLQPERVKKITSQLSSFYGINTSFNYDYSYYDPEDDRYNWCPIAVNESTIDIDTGDDGLITIGR